MRDFKAFVRQHLASVALPREREFKIVEELGAQIEESYEALVAEGLSDEEAWNEVQRHIPDWKTFRDELLEAEPVIVRLAQPEYGPLAGAPKRALLSRIRAFFGLGLVRDLRSSVRLLIKNRGYTATTTLTLAVCLGANAAIFTVVHSVLLRPLPVPDSDRIVAMGDVYPTITPNDILSNTAPSYFDRLKALTALEEQAMFTLWFDTLAIDGTAEELRGMRATPSLFRVLQVNPALGRAFTDGEGEIGADKKIILSHALWQRLYGGDQDVIGRDLRLGWTGQRYTIVGVMPRGLSFFDSGDDGHAREQGNEIDFWIPLAFTAAQRSDASRTRYGYFHIGRLRPDATVEQVQAQADALNAANFKRFPDLGVAELHMYTAVTPLQDALTRGVSRILYLLWGGVAFVLLIGTLNIANLSLARASVRARELATQLALGAGRLRVTRQLILEGVLLAGIGGVAGVGVAIWILRTLVSSGLANLPNAASLQMGWTVIGFTLAVSVVVGVLIGLVPAATLNRLNLNQVLAEGSRGGTTGRTTNLFRRGLVVAQVACSVVLLIGAGLLLTSFRNLLAVDAGFDAQRVTTATIFPPPSRYKDPAAVVALSNHVLESIRSIPGVQSAGMTTNIALSGRTSPAEVSAVDRNPQPGEALVLPSVVSVTPGYFEAMSTPLVRGRFFSETDQERTPLVAIVDERLAARFWPNEDAIGKRLRRGDSEPYTVVGVVRGVRFESLAGQTENVGTAYFPDTQTPLLGRLRWIAVKTASEPAALTPALRAALKAIDPELPLSDVQTMTQRTSRSIVPQRLAMGLASMYGIVALLLSVLGLYGVLAYVVARKTREIGIRMALGSTPRGIFQIFFKEGLTLVAGGLMLGLLGALVLGRALEGQVFGVRPTDPFVLGTVAVLTGIVALLACVSPAYRAARVDPLKVLSEQ
ncbi:MAG TPA: ABC transporter permease [Vicinamibacterales bacterium]|nr:ABC transporter permease [Vicinamibacterales bacterium]